MSRKLGLGAVVGTLVASLVLAFAVTATPAADAHSGQGAGNAKAAFHDAMRKLWEDHVVWTRQFIVSAATESGNLPDIGPTTDRLLANQTDIGNALKPFYGDAAGDPGDRTPARSHPHCGRARRGRQGRRFIRGRGRVQGLVPECR